MTPVLLILLALLADTFFNHNGTDGGTVAGGSSVTWMDGTGQTHEVFIYGGIVSSWLIGSNKQLTG